MHSKDYGTAFFHALSCATGDDLLSCLYTARPCNNCEYCRCLYSRATFYDCIVRVNLFFQRLLYVSVTLFAVVTIGWVATIVSISIFCGVAYKAYCSVLRYLGIILYQIYIFKNSCLKFLLLLR